MTEKLTAFDLPFPIKEANGWTQIEVLLNRRQLEYFISKLDTPAIFDGSDSNNLSELLFCTGMPTNTFSNFEDIPSLYLSKHDFPERLEQVPFASGLIGFLSYDYGEALQLKSINKGSRISDSESTDTRKRLEDIPSFQARHFTWSYTESFDTKKGLLTFSDQCSHDTRAQIIKLIQDTIISAGNEKSSLGGAENLSTNTSVERITWTKSSSYLKYSEAFLKIKEYILAGDCYQANLTHRFEALLPEKISALDYYFDVFREHSAPYSCLYSIADNQHILSFSPEQFLNIKEHTITSRPIKGTSLVHDQNQLKHSKKDKAENLMIVDLIRNDLGKISENGSIKALKLFDLEKHGQLAHLVSSIQGELKKTINPLDALVSCFPGGSITGAPKLRAMEIIQELETHRRSVYCGSIFYLSSTGNLDSNILIRTVLHNQGHLFCWAGGGIVHDSELEKEYKESLDKVSHITGILG